MYTNMAKCLSNFLKNFLKNFLTYNLLTIASFRIGVPSILFLATFEGDIFKLSCAKKLLFYC